MNPEKDYELKIKYLTDHLSRMWTRFNYLLGIQTAIAGGKLFLPSDKYDGAIAFMGLLFATIWYMLGAQDRFLCELYRNQLHQAYLKIGDSVPVSYVGQVKGADEASLIQRGLLTWRWEPLSSTKMAALVPFVIGILWIVYLLLKAWGKF